LRYKQLNHLLRLTFSFVLTGLILCSSSNTSFAESEPAFIQTRSASLQAEPKLLAKALHKLSYGDSVLVISSNANWSKVTSSGRSGYIHNSALSSRKLILSAKTNLGNTSSETDISLGGKGFSSEVEKQLAATNSKLNFKAVDRMENLSVTQKQTVSFIKSGKLNQGDL